MHHCLQGVYLDHRRIERILLSHTEFMIFDISCSLARPCQVFFDWRHWVIWRVGQGLQKRKPNGFCSELQWMDMDDLHVPIAGLLESSDHWFRSQPFHQKAPNWPKKKALWISELIRATLFSRPKKKKFHLQFTTQDWIEIHQFMYLMGDFITYNNLYTLQGTNISPQNCILKMIFLFPRWDMLIPWRVYTHYRTPSFDCLSSLEMSWGGVDADSDASSAHHTMLPVWLPSVEILTPTMKFIFPTKNSCNEWGADGQCSWAM